MMRCTRVARDFARQAVTDLSRFPKPGDKIHGFTLLQTKQVPELELTALHLQHDKTGAQHVHVARDDSNNVFSIGFKTNPPDDTGVPHILEHTTLCGSDKYPIRDPFFKMLPRTLSNFMNAFTASGHTYYPFATTNRKDFSNLMAVYLDATLHPLLRESDFIQEGWRIGPEHPEALPAGKAQAAHEAAPAAPDPDHAKLVFKGVVYNEMKGAMSDASSLYCVRFQDHIFPAINNSGGDPRHITDLTYAQLKKFHAEHYHPSNARLFSYGDMPLADHLRDIGARLDAFGKMPQDTANYEPISLSGGPQEVTVFGPVDPLVDPNKQFKTSVSWVLGDTSHILESFSLSMISALVMDGYGSPLYKGLIESGLGTEWSPNTGYDGSAKRAIFSIGLTGVQEANVPKIKSEVQAILQAVRQKGFERIKIDGHLHQLELALKHKTPRFGVSLLHRLKSQWFGGGASPLDSLTWNDTVAAFEAELAKDDYLGGLMDKYLLNDDTLTFTMAPSSTYGQEIADEENSRLQAKIAQAAELAGGREKAQAQFEAQELQLQAEQAKSNTEDLDCLPSVHVQDIPRQKPESSKPRFERTGAANVQWQEASTNGLTYFRAIHPLENIPDSLRAMIPLFTDAIMAIGTKDMTMEQLEDLINLKTGGVSCGYLTTALPTNFTQATEGLLFSGTALDRNVPAMFDLVRKLVLETDFNNAEAVRRVRQLLQASADGVVNSIASSGHAYARRVAEAGLTRSAYLSEQVEGLSQVKLVASLASRPDTDPLSDFLDKLKQIQAFALTGNLRVALTCDHHSVQANEKALSSFLTMLPSDAAAKFPQQSQASVLSSSIKTFFPLPYQVYYGGLAVPTASYTSPDGAPLAILAKLLTHKHLHHEIREKGGAYGGGAYSRAVGGLFGLYSYRDPNPVGTLRVMGGAGRWAAERAWAARDLEEAKISVFQGVDAPRAASDEGMDLFLHGIDDAMQQRRRAQLLDVTADQVRDVARRYLVDALAAGAERTVFIGEKKDWVDASWTVEDMNINGGVD